MEEGWSERGEGEGRMGIGEGRKEERRRRKWDGRERGNGDVRGGTLQSGKSPTVQH